MKGPMIISSGTDWFRGIEARDSYRGASNDHLESGEEVVGEVIAGLRLRVDRLLRRAKLIAAASEERGGLALEAAEGGLSDVRVFDGDPENPDAWWYRWLEEQGSAYPSSVAGVRTPRPRSVQEVEFLPQAAPRVVIQLSSGARRGLNRESSASRPRTISAPRAQYERGTYADAPEVGGYLFGRFTRDALADVDVIIGAGASAVSTPTSITFDVADRPAGAFENELREVFDNRSTRLIGDFHTHPNGVGIGRPSAGDLRSWARLLERLQEERNESRFVGLIGVSDGHDGGLFRVDWHAWVLQRTPGGRLICEPAIVEGA